MVYASLSRRIRLATSITLYPIQEVADASHREPFDPSKLPAQISPNVTIENVECLFDDTTFHGWESQLSGHDVESLAQGEIRDCASLYKP